MRGLVTRGTVQSGELLFGELFGSIKLSTWICLYGDLLRILPR